MGDEDRGISSPTQLGGVIPHFFYDLIGRIIPGSFFIAGLFIVLLPENSKNLARQTFLELASEKTAGAAVFLGSVGVLSFALSGYFAGFLLGSVSFWFFEEWTRFRPKFLRFPALTLPRLFSSFGGPAEDEQMLKDGFKKRFGFNLDISNARAVARQSWLCAYFVWARNSNLGQMTTRWDAETLASRSLLFSAMALSLAQVVLVTRLWIITCHIYWRLLFALLTITLLALPTYKYERRRQIIGRFFLFCSLSPRNEVPPSAQELSEAEKQGQ